MCGKWENFYPPPPPFPKCNYLTRWWSIPNLRYKEGEAQVPGRAAGLSKSTTSCLDSDDGIFFLQRGGEALAVSGDVFFDALTDGVTVSRRLLFVLSSFFFTVTVVASSSVLSGSAVDSAICEKCKMRSLELRRKQDSLPRFALLLLLYPWEDENSDRAENLIFAHFPSSPLPSSPPSLEGL